MQVLARDKPWRYPATRGAFRASTPIALFAKNILKIVDTSQVSDFSKQLVITNIWTVTIIPMFSRKYARQSVKKMVPRIVEQARPQRILLFGSALRDAQARCLCSQ
jgi:hypothetical protein